MIKKADIVLLIAVIIIGIVPLVFTAAGNAAGERVVVYVDGDVYGTYALDTDREIVIENGSNINNVIIKSGKVSMQSSTCRNQICVHTGSISETKDSIVCLPNRVVIAIEGGKGGAVDAISK